MKMPDKFYLTFATLMLGFFFTLALHEPVLNPNPTAAEQILSWAASGIVGFITGFIGAIILYNLLILCLTLPIILLHALFDR